MAQSRSRGRSTGGGRSSAGARALTDHEEIIRWAEERGAHPACVRRTGGNGDIGMIRLDFPGYSGEQSLEPVSWDEWFEKFDESKLALLVQDSTASGEQSNFNKLIGRETAEKRERGVSRASRRHPERERRRVSARATGRAAGRKASQKRQPARAAKSTRRATATSSRRTSSKRGSRSQRGRLTLVKGKSRSGHRATASKTGRARSRRRAA